MAPWFVIVVLIALGASYWLGKRRAYGLSTAGTHFHSRPQHHGAFVLLCVLVPAALVLLLWMTLSPIVIEHTAVAALSPEIKNLDKFRLDGILREIRQAAQGKSTLIRPEIALSVEAYKSAVMWTSALKWAALVAFSMLGLIFGLRQVGAKFRARNKVERFIHVALIACAAIAVLTTIGIVLSLIFETLRFFSKYPFLDFIFGLQWSPQIALRADQAGASGAFGMLPLLGGTLLITFIAMLVAAPIGLFAAIYMAEYASARFRAFAKPILEILAGIPTVVFGFFAALTVAPAIRGAGEALGLSVASESALAAGIVMGVMIIPFVSSLSDDVITAVPQSLRDGSHAVGATHSETIKKVVLPAALPGIVSSMMLAISRAIGETMIVVMAAGLSANLTLNPLEAVTTFTVQIKTLLVGDQEFDSVKTLSAFALGFVLFFITLTLNIIALRVVKKYREQYD